MTKRRVDKIIGLWGHLIDFRKHIRDKRSKRRQLEQEALTMVKQLDDLEDRRGLEVEEVKEQKGW